jgi:hypothetical protein
MNTVHIKWEHGASFETEGKYKFKTLDEMKAFLDFIYDFRRFVKGRGYENLGHFSDSHEERLAEWLKEVDAKHGNKFTDYVEMDKKYGTGDYSAKVEHIWTVLGGVKHYIVWTKAVAQTVRVELPERGSILDLTTGGINFIGPEIFGGKDKDYIGYEKFDDLGKPKGDGTKASQYPKIKAKVLDCRPQFYTKRELGGNYNFDWTAFHYELLLENERGRFTSEMHGHDPGYERKYGRSLYEKIKVIEI